MSKRVRESDSDDENGVSVTKKKKSLCTYLKKWEEEYNWLRPVQGNPTQARCMICANEFKIGHGGLNDVKKHSLRIKHVSKSKDVSSSKKISDSFHSAASTELNLKTSAELAFVYHTVKHGLSYNSMDCSIKLMKSTFSDSEIAKGQACGRTKAEAIVTNVLAPKVTSDHLSFVSNNQTEDLHAVPYAISVDASNRGNRKMFPICIRYFNPKVGIQSFLLDFLEEPDECSASISEMILRSLSNHDLNVQNACAYGADNAHVNFGKNKSVFKSLKEKCDGNLLKAGCSNHIIHNALKHACNFLKLDIEIVVLKIYSYFSSSAKRRANLQEFFEFVDCEWNEILRHVTTRWLSLTPAVERVLKIWDPLSSYFKSNDCPQVLAHIFSDDPTTESIARIYLNFFVNVGSFVQVTSKILEKEDLSVIEAHNEMVSMLSKLQKRKEECWYGSEASMLLSSLLPQERKKIEQDFDGFYDTVIGYLKKNYDFDDYKKCLSFLAVSKDVVPVFNDFLIAIKSMGMENKINVDILFEEYTDVKDKILELLEQLDDNKSIEERWVYIFSSIKKDIPYMKKFIGTVLAIPGSNANVERIFSLMKLKWTDSRNRCSTILMKSELQVCVNSKLDCKEFYNIVKSDLKTLKDARSSEKYGQ